MWFDQTVVFLQEWGVFIVVALSIALAMVADLIPKLAFFMLEIDQRYPRAKEYLLNHEQYVVDCYDRLPVRIRAGFALIGGQHAWAWLVKAGYAYLRRKQKNV